LAAEAANANPWAVYGALRVRVLAEVPPWYRLRSGGPLGGNLNTFTALTGPSGEGKGLAQEVSEYLWPLDPDDVAEAKVASGEAICRKLKRRNDALGPVWIPRMRSLIIKAPEFAGMAKAAQRQSSTLTEVICELFTGEDPAASVADDARNIPSFAKNSYRAGLLIGIQHANARMLLGDDAAGTGLPQRMTWFPARPDAIKGLDELPDAPPPLKPDAPLFVHDEFRPDDGGEVVWIDVWPGAIEELLSERKRAHAAGEEFGHRGYCRLKEAYCLAVLAGRTTQITEDDWWLSGVLQRKSDDTLAAVYRAMAEQGRRRAESAAKYEAIRKVAGEQTAEQERLRSANDAIVRYLRKNVGAAVNRADLDRKALWGDKEKGTGTRAFRDPAITELVEAGIVAEDSEGWLSLV
jgi:hypothetical protein